MAGAETHAPARKERPLSPHLQIYSRTISMMMSIVHRITGGALYFGTLLLAWWLIAAAIGPDYFAFVNGLYGSPLGMIILFGYTWALMHHMLGGMRHFIWDTGRAFDLESIRKFSWLSLICSIALTIIIWFVVLSAKGVL
ncbi:MAG: succinate dehydrogenase, cytochrome b556 subunit [Hyphomicrobiaceae bacterium]